MKYLLDTNIVIYYMNNLLAGKTLSFVDSIVTQPILELSVITKIETLGFAFATAEQRKSTELFLKEVQWLPLHSEIIDTTIQLRQQYKLKTPDAIIAATALVGNYTLVSRNDKDFSAVKELSYYNPFNL